MLSWICKNVLVHSSQQYRCTSFICLNSFNFEANEVERKADDMAKAIAQQNKKVEQESDAMEKAIEEKRKQLNTKEQEENFEKASKEVDAFENKAETKFEEKGG